MAIITVGLASLGLIYTLILMGYRKAYVSKLKELEVRDD